MEVRALLQIKWIGTFLLSINKTPVLWEGGWEGGREGTFYNVPVLYGDALLERGTIFRLAVYKRVGIAPTEVQKRVSRVLIRRRDPGTRGYQDTQESVPVYFYWT